MATSKESKIQVTGLVTQPNPYSATPPGSLSLALNCVSRRKGVIEPLPGNTSMATFPIQTPVRIFNNWEQTYFIALEKFNGVAYAELIHFQDSGSAVSSVPTGNTLRSLRFDPGVSQATFSRFRHILSEHSSPITVEAFSVSSHSSVPRLTGLPSPLFPQVNYVSDTPANSANGYVAYKAIFRKVYTHFTVDSAPSPIGMGFGTSGNALFVRLYFDAAKDPIRAGDNVVLYRVKQQATVNLLGDDYHQVVVYTLTSTDIANGFAFIQDKVLDADLDKGAVLYTNSLQEGATQANLMPPPCVDVATFNDTTFYVSKSSWPIVSLSIPGKYGTLAGGTTDVRKNGIGFRTLATATSTASSPTLTGIPDVTGVAVGQLVVASSAGFPAGTRILSISGAGPFTVVMDHNASTTTVGTVFITDVLTIRAYKDASLIATGIIPLTIDVDQAVIATAAAVPGVKWQINSIYDPAASTIPGLDFAIWSPISGTYDRLEVDVTNGQNYSTRGTMTGTTGFYMSVQDNAINRAYYSKTSLPEAVAPTNFLDIGNERVLKLWASESALFAFCTDGMWRVTGAGTDWTVNQIDKTTNLVHPDCVYTGENQIFAWITEGLAAVGENGSQVLSREAIGPALDDYLTAVRADGAPFSWGPQVSYDRRRREAWLNICYTGTSTFRYDIAYILNLDSGAFTHQNATQIRSLVYSDYLTQQVTATADDYFLPSTTTWQDVTVIFNPIVAGDLGVLKEWIDTNLFVDNIAFSGGANSVIQILFGGETSGSSNKYTIDTLTAQNLHCWIPRRVASKTQLVYGFTTNPDSDIKMNFRCYGFTARLRVASDTIKR